MPFVTLSFKPPSQGSEYVSMVDISQKKIF